MNRFKLLKKILSGSNNIRFGDFVAAVEAFDFRLSRVNGSHHIFTHDEIPELLNLQNYKRKAKAYQIRQFLVLIETYNMSMED